MNDRTNLRNDKKRSQVLKWALQILINFKLLLGAVVLLAMLSFSLQNALMVEVRFLAWKFTTSLALIIFSALTTGLIGGWALTSALHRSNRNSSFGA
jgi:uncharacterized integral membrane protein